MKLLRASICAAPLALALSAPAMAQQQGGVLWKDRPNVVLKEDEKHERSLVPVILSGFTGGVLGIELVVVTAGIAAGSTASWWLLGTIGATTGAVSGAAAGEYFFNRRYEKDEPNAKTAKAQP